MKAAGLVSMIVVAVGPALAQTPGSTPMLPTLLPPTDFTAVCSYRTELYSVGSLFCIPNIKGMMLICMSPADQPDPKGADIGISKNAGRAWWRYHPEPRCT